MKIKVDLRKNSCPDFYRGLGNLKKITLVGWKSMKDEDLSYLLKYVLGPCVVAYNGKITLK